MNRFRLVLIVISAVFAFSAISQAQTPPATSAEKPARSKVSGKAKKSAEEMFDPEDAKLPLVSPYGAVARSAFAPGWGQIKIRQPVQGAFFFVTTVGLATGWILVYRDFRDIYDNGYLVAVKVHGLNSDEAEDFYVVANQRYKTSRALLFTMMGVWAYSLIDAYVDASIYNAELRSKRVLEEGEQIRKINIRWKNGPLIQWIGRF